MKTLLFLKCIDRRYASQFISNGAIRLSKPREWTIIKESSRGDVYEGVYAKCPNKGLFDIKRIQDLRKDSRSILCDDFTLFYSDSVLNMRTYCLYGLNDNDLIRRDRRSQDHKYHSAGVIPKAYFQKLYPHVTEENYYTIPEDNRPVLLIIKPDEFYRKLIEYFNTLGMQYQTDFLFMPVNYYDSNNSNLFCVEKAPFELFFKSSDYSEQNEIRLVITSDRPEIVKIFEENDGVIHLGDMTDVASISDYYFDDMQVEERGTQLYYSIPKPIVRDATEDDIIGWLVQILSDEMPKSPMTISEMKKELMECEIALRDYNVYFDKKTNVVITSRGEKIKLDNVAVRILNHYNDYMIEGDLNGAKECIDKIHEFFPNLSMGDYFSGYYSKIESMQEPSV